MRRWGTGSASTWGRPTRRAVRGTRAGDRVARRPRRRSVGRLPARGRHVPRRRRGRAARPDRPGPPGARVQAPHRRPTPILLGGTPYSAARPDGPAALGGRPSPSGRARPDAVVVTYPANWGPYKRELLSRPSSWPTSQGPAASPSPRRPPSLRRQERLGSATSSRSTTSAAEPSTRRCCAGPRRLRAARRAGRHRAARRRRLRRRRVRPRPRGARARLATSTRTTPATPRRWPGCAATACGQGGALRGHRGPRAGRAARPAHRGAAHPRRVRGEIAPAARRDGRGAAPGVAVGAGRARRPPAVLLAGGSSRIPLVAETLSAELGRPLAVDAHPKHVVALGAALAARPPHPPAPPPRGPVPGAAGPHRWPPLVRAGPAPAAARARAGGPGGPLEAPPGRSRRRAARRAEPVLLGATLALVAATLGVAAVGLGDDVRAAPRDTPCRPASWSSTGRTRPRRTPSSSSSWTTTSTWRSLRTVP